MPEIVGEYVDRLVNLEMRVQGGLPRGVTHRLYEAARKKQGAPLTFLAAHKLIDALKPGSHAPEVSAGGDIP